MTVRVYYGCPDCNPVDGCRGHEGEVEGEVALDLVWLFGTGSQEEQEEASEYLSTVWSDSGIWVREVEVVDEGDAG